MDDRDFPLTMNKPQRHEFEISCQCEPCKAIVQRQMKCTHSMIGKSPICVHCGCTESNKNKYDEMMATAFPWGGMNLQQRQGHVHVSPPKKYQIPDALLPCGCKMNVVGQITYYCSQHNRTVAVPTPNAPPAGAVSQLLRDQAKMLNKLTQDTLFSYSIPVDPTPRS